MLSTDIKGSKPFKMRNKHLMQHLLSFSGYSTSQLRLEPLTTKLFLYWQTPDTRGQEETSVIMRSYCPSSSMRWAKPTSLPLKSPSSWEPTSDLKTISQRERPTRASAEERDSKWWDMEEKIMACWQLGLGTHNLTSVEGHYPWNTYTYLEIRNNLIWDTWKSS